MDSSGNQIGTISEDSGLLAIVRRFVPFAIFLIPQEFVLSTGDIRLYSLNLEESINSGQQMFRQKYPVFWIRSKNSSSCDHATDSD